MNKPITAFLLSIVMMLVSGCSPEEGETGSGSTVAPSQPAEAVSIGQPAGTVPPPPVGTVAPPTQPAAIDLSQAERPKNAQGDAMSDLEYLNHLVAELNESRISSTEIPQRTFKTEAEQMAYEAEEQKKRQGPVRDVNELVTAGVLKALPQAPAGQRYAIDPASGKVILQ